MSAYKDGGSAFPISDLSGYGIGPPPDGPYGGMSLRDWFAGHALAGLIASPAPIKEHPDINPELIAELAYEYADALIARRKERA